MITKPKAKVLKKYDFMYYSDRDLHFSDKTKVIVSTSWVETQSLRTLRAVLQKHSGFVNLSPFYTFYTEQELPTLLKYEIDSELIDYWKNIRQKCLLKYKNR